MNDNNNFALVPRPPGVLEKAEPGAKRILSGMVADTLELTKRNQSALSAARFRIGEYEWCEPDYRQILIWANVLALEPEEVIGRLLQGQRPEGVPWAESVFADGRLIKLNWDLNLLPLDRFQLVIPLEITHLSIRSRVEPHEWGEHHTQLVKSLKLRLPKLTNLSCERLGLPELDLILTPNLRALLCGQNNLSELDFSVVPELNILHCGVNQFRELKLSALDNLTELDCASSWISPRVILSAMPNLSRLDCGWNDPKVVAAFLSHAPNLTELNCMMSSLKRLDLSGVPHLTKLECNNNITTKLDLSLVPKLKELNCRVMGLRKLDLSHTHNLLKLNCWGNDLNALDLSAVPELQVLDCVENSIDVLDIRRLLHLHELKYDSGRTHLMQRPDQNFEL
jgi:hypothetical protein